MTENDYMEIMDLDPEAFDWLDMAEEFFKHDGSFSFGEERNRNVIRAGERYDEIEREFNQLEKLYEACPEHVVEPLMPVYRDVDGEKRMAGFYMERFDGELLKDYLLDLTERGEIMEGLRLVDEIRETVDKIHREGAVHGDLTNNILYDGETFKFFDPVGEPYDQEAYRDMREWDRSTPERLEKTAKAPFQDFL
ncbi:hypothetical protein ACK3SF_03045 [Candidatus Nanosalina sp. VS9-1]|uniref:hypothetical protein n=1 Tax=Candidatus Nanosalina sp. VS9-1 TaxID=3388566 RepID=UPI0039DF37AA